LVFRDKPITIVIEADTVKVAQLGEGRGRVRTIRFAEQPLPPGFRWEIGADRAPVVRAIRLALSRAGIRGRRAVMVLPRRQVTARIGTFPSVDRSQLRRVVEIDVSDHIPFPLEQVVVDFQPLGPSGDQPGLTDVLVVAAQRDLVRQYLALAADLRLRTIAVTVDALALHDLVRLAGEPPPGFTLAVEVGARATVINVSQGDRLRLTRSVGLGEESLNQAIKDDLGVELAEAERLKSSDGLQLLDRQPRPPRVAAWLESLQGEMRRSALTFGPSAVSRILLTGNGAALPGLPEAVAAEFGADTAVLSVARLFPEAALRDPTENTNRFLISVAGGLLGVGRSAWTISLIPSEVMAERRARRRRTAGLVAAALAAAVLITGYFSSARNIARQQANVRQLEGEAAAAQQHRKESDQFVQERDRLRELADALALPRIRRHAVLEVLRTIALYAPPEIELTSFAMEPPQPLSIAGKAPTMAAAAQLQADLAQSQLLTDVVTQRAYRTTAGTRTRQQEYVTFIISAHLWTERWAETEQPSIRLLGGPR
jgi:type IV pilus assembly protein PilM